VVDRLTSALHTDVEPEVETAGNRKPAAVSPNWKTARFRPFPVTLSAVASAKSSGGIAKAKLPT